MNITAITEEREIIARHYIDCLFAAELLPAGANVLDVGSGGGMPTLPFAIVRPDVTVTALDATAKRRLISPIRRQNWGFQMLKLPQAEPRSWEETARIAKNTMRFAPEP